MCCSIRSEALPYTAVGGPRTSTPIPTAVPSTSSPVPRPRQPSVKRKLFHRDLIATTAQGAQPAEPARDNQATPTARPTADFSQDRRSYISFKEYCQHLTYYFLHTLDILRGKKKEYDFNYIPIVSMNWLLLYLAIMQAILV